MGTACDQLPDSHWARKEVAPALATLQPEVNRVLRYEWRAALLKQRGTIHNPITYADHYAPVVERLLAA